MGGGQIELVALTKRFTEVAVDGIPATRKVTTKEITVEAKHEVTIGVGEHADVVVRGGDAAATSGSPPKAI